MSGLLGDWSILILGLSLLELGLGDEISAPGLDNLYNGLTGEKSKI